MAGNKFVIMLNKNTNKTILILIYAVLEWILIILLLINSLFSYFIAKFAQYFALKQPCTLCSTLDHIFNDPNAQSYRDRICHSHATEISNLSYCSSHKKLAESHRMCVDCSSSRPNHHNDNVKRIAFVSIVSGDSEEERFCSCCNGKATSGKYLVYSLFKNGIFDFTQKSCSVLNYGEDEHQIVSNGEDYSNLQSEDEKEGIIVSYPDAKFVDQFADDDIIIECSRRLDDSLEIIGKSPEEYPERLIPIELIDESTTATNLSINLPELRVRDDMELDLEIPVQNAEDIRQLNLTDKNSQVTEAEEEKLPEDSLDGSVAEGGDPVLTVEWLKTVLKAERKALSSLYTELDEERSASAVSTSQTMAMINRLHEEKAKMQMEALQYQRMMEEQAEYDQEALQLMNELMIKREKEKQQLEKDLEILRQKCLEYETRKKIRKIDYSASYSNEEYSEELSIDLNREAMDEDGDNVISPADAILDLEEIALDCVKNIGNLDESLDEFEEERQSILDQLKALEEKIFILGDGELIDSLNSAEHSSAYNIDPHEHNQLTNGNSEDQNYTMSSMGKNLLPLLDAEEEYESEENLSNEELKMKLESVNKMQECLDSKFKEVDDTELEHEEEVDDVYERLKALEADKEFLEHCMSSMNNGEKGMDLLQEILQHLRDLKAVEMTNDTLQ